jgi:hypothetical protein
MNKTTFKRSHLSIFVLLIVLLMQPFAAQAQKDKILPRSQSSNFEGRHFYVGFMRNELDQNRRLNYPVFLNIFVAATVTSEVIIRFPWQTAGGIFTIRGDSILTIEIPQKDVPFVEMRQSEVPLYGIIEITSDQKIAVSAMTSFDYSSDAYTALPVPNWGKEYVIMSMANDTYEQVGGRADSTPRSGEFLVMASEDSTLVQFKARVKTMKHDSAQFVSLYLMKGQCYLVQSSDSLDRSYGDLTGTIVRSNKPIGVLSGHVRTSIPVIPRVPNERPRDSKDCLVEMLIPTKIWGTKYATSPFYINCEGDLFRVACIQPNTTFTAQGSTNSRTITLKDPGDWVEFYPVGQTISWTSDKPISIAQYMPTSFFDDVQDFDPAMVIIPPIEQYISRALFQIQPNPDWKYDKFYYNYVNVICEPSAVNSLKLDGTPVLVKYPKLATQRISGMNMNYVVIPVQPGVHNLTADSGMFSGIVYGVGPDDSYAYPLGLSLYKASGKDTIPPIITYSENCGRVKITTQELITDSTVGIETVKVIADSTRNFTWTMTTSSDTTTSVEINADPIDITRNAIIVIEARDKLGNGRQFTYFYNALSIEVQNNILFQPVNWLDSVCERVVVRNNGTDTVKFLGSMITGDQRVHFSGGIPLIQRFLAPNDSVAFMVCFKPEGDSSLLKATLSLQLPCNRQLDVPIAGLVAAPSIMVVGWDFGKVLIGDSACAVALVINNGNTPITIRSLTINPFETALTLDTAGLFPRSLLPNDTLRIPVCFIPDVVRIFSRNGVALNNLNLSTNIFTVKGEGVSPLVESVDYNWQKQRIVTSHDTIIRLVNRGNYDAVIDYISASGDTASLNSIAEFSLPITLRPFSDTLRIPARFFPKTVQNYHSIYTLQVSNWRLHKPVTITLDGEGTLPTITTLNVDFDTIPFRKTKDTSAIVISSGGNEQLTIDTMIIASGDISSFVIDNQYLTGRTLLPTTNYTIPIRFAPTRTGLHTAEILVIHDALPAFERDTARILLMGVAINSDSLSYSFNMVAPQTVHACSSDTIKIVLKNTGNRPLDFQSIVSSATNMLVVPIAVPIPQIIERDSSLKIAYTIQMTKGSIGTVTFMATCNDTIIQIISQSISSISNPLTLTQNPDITVAPGTQIELPFTGIVDVEGKIPFLLNLTAGLNFQTMTLQSRTGIIEYSDARQTRSIPAIFRQERTKITVAATQSIDIDTLTHWKVVVPFHVMLSDSSSITIAAQVDDTLHECFAEGSTQRMIYLSPVCANLLRRIKQSDPAFQLVSVTPSPVGEIGEAHCIIQGTGIVTLEAVNQLGERFPLAAEHLTIGEYIVRFSTEQLSDGVYGIILRAADGREQRSVVVIAR